MKIKDNQLHEGLPKRFLRDFFAVELEKVAVAGYTKDEKAKIEAQAGLLGKTMGQRTIALAELEVKYAQKRLDDNIKCFSLKSLMEDKGWSEWDMSDFAQRTSEYYLPFIGNQVEYADLMKRLGIPKDQWEKG